MLGLPHKEMHEECDTEEQHRQTTANLCDNGEVLHVRARHGFIKRCLQRTKSEKANVLPTSVGSINS